MTTSLTNISLDPDTWIDICAVHPATASSDMVLRCLSAFSARIVHGGAAAPVTLDSGDVLNPDGAAYANADHVWVSGRGALSITLL